MTNATVTDTSKAKRAIAEGLRFIDETKARLATGGYSNPWQAKLAEVLVVQTQERIFAIWNDEPLPEAPVAKPATPATIARSVARKI